MKVFAIHGNAQSNFIYQNFETDITPLELPGHGNNSDTLENYSIENYAEYLTQKITEDCTLVGHSLGGHVALELALRNSHIKGLISIGAPLINNNSLDKAFNPLEELAVIYEDQPLDQKINAFCKAQMSSEENTKMLFQAFKQQDPHARVSFLESISSGVKDEFEKHKSLTIPYFAVFGKNDRFINLDYIRTLSLDHLFFVDSGHNVMLDNEKIFLDIINKMKDLIS